MRAAIVSYLIGLIDKIPGVNPLQACGIFLILVGVGFTFGIIYNPAYILSWVVDWAFGFWAAIAYGTGLFIFWLGSKVGG